MKAKHCIPVLLFVMFLLPDFCSAQKAASVDDDTCTNKKHTVTYNASTNVLKNSKLTIHSDDVVTIVINEIALAEFPDYKVNEVSKTDLNPSVSIKTEKLAGASGSKIFTVTGLEQGKLYKYEIKKTTSGKDDILLAQFYIEVIEIINVEVTAGPVFSWLPNPDFELLQIRTEGDNKFVNINNKGSAAQADLVLGGTFRPWGYNPRESFGFRNIFFYLGVPLTNTVYENYFAGIGYGGKGFNLMIGGHIGKINELKSNYSLYKEYNSADIEVDKISQKVWSASYFCGIAIDLGVFKKVFPSVKFE